MVDLLVCRSFNFEFWILCNVWNPFFFQLKTTLKLMKREFYWPKFSCLTDKKFIFSLKSKHKNIHCKYYVMFKIQKFQLRTLANQRMRYQWHWSLIYIFFGYKESFFLLLFPCFFLLDQKIYFWLKDLIMWSLPVKNG